MGFYGKIGNTIKTEMYFNLKYSSRYQMEKHCAGDGVGAGAYVLIEYDYNWDETGINITGITNDMLPQVYKSPRNGLFYTDTAYSHLYEPIEETFFQVIADIETSSGVSKRVYEYYLYTQNDEKTGYVYKLLTSAESQNSGINYVINFNLDVEKYKHSRGYDSTVWQKVYTEGVPKYVQIAELNSVTPTFRIDVDAPSPIPRPPHFAADSTNILYTLHLQPSWGLRIAKAESNEKSDYKGIYYKYNSNAEKYEEIRNQDLRIYYNKDGFDKNIHNKAPESNSDNEISLKQASSGQTYINLAHTDNLNSSSYPTSSTENDLYEFRCILPILGDTICHLYDLAYGYDKTDEYKSSRRYTDIAWRQPNSTDSLELRTTDLETIAGCINKTHDLMGMIIYNINSLPSTVPNSHKEKIVEVNNKYYRVYGYGEITPVTSTTSTDIDWYVLLDDEIGSENTYIPSLRWYNTAALGYQENMNLVYLNTNKMVYKYVEMEGFANSLNTIHGCLMRVSQILGDDLPQNTRDKQTVKGVINHLTDVIDLFGKVKKLEIAVTNSNGVVQTAPIVDDNTWIEAVLNKTENNEEISNISIKHNVKFNQDQEFNTTIDATTGIKYSAITTLQYDKAGHIKNIVTGNIDIPFSFKSINSVSAKQMGDSLSLNGDDYVNITNDENNNIIKVSHKTQTIEKVNSNDSPIYLKNIDNFTIKTIDFDSAGHAKKESSTTIIPAPAFGQINNLTKYDYVLVSNDENFSYEKNLYYYLDEEEYKIDTSDSSTPNREYFSRFLPEDSLGNNNQSLIAKKNFSDLNVISGNKWINIFTNSNDNSISFSHTVLNTDGGDFISSPISSFRGQTSIPSFNYDKAGHIYTHSTTVLTLPGFNYTEEEGTSSNAQKVLVDYRIEDNGNYYKNFSDIGVLPLTGYSNENITVADIVATDNLNKAIAVLEKRIKELENRVQTLEGNSSQ